MYKFSFKILFTHRKTVIFSVVGIGLLIFLILQFFFLYKVVLGAIYKFAPAAETTKYIFKNCQKNRDKGSCYAEHLVLLAELKGLKPAKQILFDLQTLDTQNAGGCHTTAHLMASAVVKQDPGSWMELLKGENAYECTGGFIHGILEGHMSMEPDFTLSSGNFAAICDQMSDQPQARISCYHNLGHLLLVEKQGDISQSIPVCEELNGEKERYECLSGIFMENLTKSNLVIHGLASKRAWDQYFIAETEKLCSSYQGMPATACWKESSYIYAFTGDYLPEKLFESCNRAPNQNSRNECYLYGSANMVVEGGFKKENINRICAFYDKDPNMYRSCVRYQIRSLLSSSLNYSDWALGFCQNIPPGYKETCLNQIGNTLKVKQVSNEDIAKICSKIEPQYQQYCIYPRN